MVEEINRQVLVVERDREVLKALMERPPAVPDGPVEYQLPSGADELDDGTELAPPAPPATGRPPTGPATIKGAAKP
jgi:hypothetical protein